MPLTHKPLLCTLLTGLGWTYLGLLLGWAFAYLVIGDRSAYLGLTAFIAVYFFLPIPVVALIAIACRANNLWVGIALAAGVYLWFWGALLVPRLRPPETTGPTLRVMTFNVLAWHNQTDTIIAAIRDENPDVLFLQELNHAMAAALQAELSGDYPYQVLVPVDNPIGIGTISKYPMQATGESLPLQWIGGPQVLSLEWQGQTVTLVNFHMVPTTRISPRAAVERSFRIREAEAQVLVELARRGGPVLMGGDANCAPLHTACRILAREMGDAWQEAGFGLGHTFPGSTIPGSDRIRLGPFYVPPWLTRIDYLFRSDEWETISAEIPDMFGVSDHRGVVAVFQLRENVSPEP